MPNAIDLLKSDHKTVRGLLAELAETGKSARKKREQLLDKIAQELEIHTTIEEEIFYPAFRNSDAKEHDKMFFEAKEEHRAVDELVLPDLENTDTGGDSFAGRAKVLKELVDHHAEEEEEEMFPAARKAIPKKQLEELGARMEERKQELKKQK